MRDQIGHHFCGRIFRLLRLSWGRGDGWLWLRWYLYRFGLRSILYLNWGGRRFGGDRSRDGKDDWFGRRCGRRFWLLSRIFPVLRLGIDGSQNFFHHGSGDRSIWRFGGRRDRRRRNYRNLRRRHRSWCYCDRWGWRNFGAELESVLWPVAKSAADLLVSHKLERVSTCQGETCGWLFLDMSKNHSRRWCSMSDCGNTAKARRHYHRKVKGDPQLA